LDLGGIAKGWTVDLAVSRLSAFENFAIDAGGDLYASGYQADGTVWTAGVENPFDVEQDIAVLAVRNRAVATSTVARRHWHRQGRLRHHLIDPRTGQPSTSGVLAATVMADTVARAEVLAKVALLLGPEQGLQFLAEQKDASGLLVLADGRILPVNADSEVQYAH
jgi:thiamine biosynthesis lipoprotein